MPAISDVPFNEPIEITPHHPEWEDRFQAEAARLRECLRAVEGIEVGEFEHFGSTSVPGLPAKPVIGLMYASHCWPPEESVLQAFVDAGYLYYGQMGRRKRQYLRRRDGQHFNIHVVEMGGDVWVDNLLFREFLRVQPDERDAYAQVKLGAYETSGGQLGEYGGIKSAHMRNLLKRAQAWDRLGRDNELFARHMERFLAFEPYRNEYRKQRRAERTERAQAEIARRRAWLQAMDPAVREELIFAIYDEDYDWDEAIAENIDGLFSEAIERGLLGQRPSPVDVQREYEPYKQMHDRNYRLAYEGAMMRERLHAYMRSIRSDYQPAAGIDHLSYQQARAVTAMFARFNVELPEPDSMGYWRSWWEFDHRDGINDPQWQEYLPDEIKQVLATESPESPSRRFAKPQRRKSAPTFVPTSPKITPVAKEEPKRPWRSRRKRAKHS